MLSLDQVTEVMDRHTDEVMRVDGVVGIAIGALPDSSFCIQVLVRERSEAIVGKLPEEIEGVPVVIEETGEIRPMESTPEAQENRNGGNHR
jgi:hypothetical protein